MKKQLIAIGLASVLTAPSVALADATIYGSFRTGLEFTSGTGASDAAVAGFYSRFGLKGSSEVSEGLTASFQIEESYDSSTATTPDAGRVGKVALSGGFGTLALGHLATATNSHFYGKVFPQLNYGTTGGATGKRSKMVSYSSSVGAVSFQIDRSTDVISKAGVVEFGASTTAGPVEVGFAYWGKEAAAATAVPLTTTTYAVSASDNVARTLKTTTNAHGTITTRTEGGEDVLTFKTENDKGIDNNLAIKENNVTVKENTEANPKTSFSGFYVSSSLAGMKLTVGLGSVDHGVDDTDADDDVDESQTDVSIIALSGSVGDSGVSYAVQISDSDNVWKLDLNGGNDTPSDPSQTVVNLTSVLGGGASLVFEHASNTGSADQSLVALKVDF